MSHQYERLLTDIRMRLPGALDDAIKRELFNALDEFLKGSYVWQQTINLPVSSTRTLYDVEPDDTAAIVGLVSVMRDGSPIRAFMPSLGELSLEMEPSTNTRYDVTIALTLADDVDEDGFPRAPDWLVIKYRDALLDGVLAKMMSQPAKPYSNERYAVYHASRFRSAISRARVEGRHQNLYGAQRWRYPQSFAVRRK